MAKRRAHSSAHPIPTNHKQRRRTPRACDRCRVKKTKCDGACPCNCCSANDAPCLFTERLSTHPRTYPQGYVEMLEQQQQWLICGLREWYRRLIEGEARLGGPLEFHTNGHPLTHALLTKLDILNRAGRTPSSETGTKDLEQEPSVPNVPTIPDHESCDSSSPTVMSPMQDPPPLGIFSQQAAYNSCDSAPLLPSQDGSSPFYSYGGQQFSIAGFGGFDDMSRMDPNNIDVGWPPDQLGFI